MSRLQKKCLIATAGFHLLLVLTILFGAAREERRAENDRQHQQQVKTRRGDQTFFLEPVHLGVGSVRSE